MCVVLWDNTNEVIKYVCDAYICGSSFSRWRNENPLRRKKPGVAYNGSYCGAAANDDVFNSNTNSSLIVWPSTALTQSTTETLMISWGMIRYSPLVQVRVVCYLLSCHGCFHLTIKVSLQRCKQVTIAGRRILLI